MPIQLLCSINVGFMNQLKSLTGVDKVESMFANDINYFYPKKEVGKKKPIRKIRIEHLYWIPSLIYRRIYGVFPRILKDIFFYLSIIHKSPSSKLFAKTRYDELRTLIDIKVSALALNRVPTSALDKVKETFNKGYYCTNLLNLSELDILINDVNIMLIQVTQEQGHTSEMEKIRSWRTHFLHTTHFLKKTIKNLI